MTADNYAKEAVKTLSTELDAIPMSKHTRLMLLRKLSCWTKAEQNQMLDALSDVADHAATTIRRP